MIALTDLANLANPRPTSLATWLNLGGLGLLIWGITTEGHLGLGGAHLAAVLLLALAVAGWLGWLVTRGRDDGRAGLTVLLVMGLTGGALAAFAPLAIVFLAVTALGAVIAMDTRPALAVAAAGPLASIVAVPAAGASSGVIASGLAAAMAGAAVGLSRRQIQERAAQAARIEVSEARAEAERARGELLAGRNHLARELHDVLAHTLSALSVQLEALDATVGAGGPPPAAVREQLDRTRRLVREGLEEARGAVRALREDAPPLPEQVARLAAAQNAELVVSGEPRALGPLVSLALYRAAQESLTNVVKHAPGASADIGLQFDQDRVVLTVRSALRDNGGSGGGADERTDLGATGGGYGLQGIQERVLLVGGQVVAGVQGQWWVVRAEVPG